MLEMAWVFLRPGPAAEQALVPAQEPAQETRKDHLLKRSAAPAAKSLH
jgi:hypothetical protein